MGRVGRRALAAVLELELQERIDSFAGTGDGQLGGILDQVGGAKPSRYRSR